MKWELYAIYRQYIAMYYKLCSEKISFMEMIIETGHLDLNKLRKHWLKVKHFSLQRDLGSLTCQCQS